MLYAPCHGCDWGFTAPYPRRETVRSRQDHRIKNALGLFDFEGDVRGIVLIQVAIPSAVFNYLFANLYDHQPEEVAGVIVVSSVICLITLP
ncbi:AEC family transporter, partial [Curvivirga aplysinae]|uniref:AEC family transporter n=1 Tax=Curvivirga aplysinae TaxID=2529852 RepID=UPI0038B3D192